MFWRKRHKHTWTKWEEVDAVATNPWSGRSREVIGQSRRCTECNLQELRRI